MSGVYIVLGILGASAGIDASELVLVTPTIKVVPTLHILVPTTKVAPTITLVEPIGRVE